MISIGDIDFNTDVADSDGIFWYCNVDGWDVLSNRTTSTDWTTEHGGLTLSNLYAPRQLSVFGTAYTPEAAADYWLARNKLANETNFLTRFTADELLVIITEDVDKQMRVLRTGLIVNCIEEGKVFGFELTLRADDPFKYAVDDSTLTTSGAAVNAGTGRTYPTFTLTAGGTPTLSDGDVTWLATGALPSGAVIDMGRMTVFDGSGNDLISDVDTASQWFSFPPGTTNVTSTVAGTWTWRSAWV